MIRYELEKALMEEVIQAADIPAFWNERYQNYLGIVVPDDKQGCLQDVHWSHGSFGYFPTYSMGSFCAAQIFATAQKELPGLETRLAEGSYATLLDWLRKTVHQHGRIYDSDQLMRKIAGEELNIENFYTYILDKYGKIYNF